MVQRSKGEKPPHFCIVEESPQTSAETLRREIDDARMAIQHLSTEVAHWKAEATKKNND